MYLSTQEYYQLLLDCMGRCALYVIYLFIGLYCIFNLYALYKVKLPRLIRTIKQETRKPYKFALVFLFAPMITLKAPFVLLKNNF